MIMVPDPRQQAHRRHSPIPSRSRESTMDAIAKGTTAGLALLLNIIAMLIVFVALVHLVNAHARRSCRTSAAKPITLQRVLGIVMAPVCWLIGIPWAQAPTAGALMGIKTVLNELIAYLQMSQAARRRARSALAADHALRDVRLRQLRQRSAS